MKEEKLLYFSPAELMVMLAISGYDCWIPDYGSAPHMPDDRELTRALAELFQRGMLQREGERLVPAGDGLLFCGLGQAENAVLLQSRSDRSGTTYISSSGMWFVEVREEGYRLQELRQEALPKWLEETFELTLPTIPDAEAEAFAERYPDVLSCRC